MLHFKPKVTLNQQVITHKSMMTVASTNRACFIHSAKKRGSTDFSESSMCTQKHAFPLHLCAQMH